MEILLDRIGERVVAVQEMICENTTSLRSEGSTALGKLLCRERFDLRQFGGGERQQVVVDVRVIRVVVDLQLDEILLLFGSGIVPPFL